MKSKIIFYEIKECKKLLLSKSKNNLRSPLLWCLLVVKASGHGQNPSSWMKNKGIVYSISRNYCIGDVVQGFLIPSLSTNHLTLDNFSCFRKRIIQTGFCHKWKGQSTGTVYAV